MRSLPVTTPETSARMKNIRQKNTAPEVAVRRLLWAEGLRFRTCVRSLPGSPDIANQRAQWAVFVHGCFWHGHTGCRRATMPKTNTAFWTEKLDGNRSRDARKVRLLRAEGYKVLTVWQCELDDPEKLSRRLRKELSPS